MGFYTTCFYIKTMKPQQWIHVFLPQKGLFPTTDQLCVMSDKRNPDNGSHLLMRVVWPEELFFFWYCLISLPFPPRRRCKLRKLKSQFPNWKMLQIPIRNKHARQQLLSPGGERGKPDGLFQPRFRWSTTEPGWLGEIEMQFGICFIK